VGRALGGAVGLLMVRDPATAKKLKKLKMMIILTQTCSELLMNDCDINLIFEIIRYFDIIDFYIFLTICHFCREY